MQHQQPTLRPSQRCSYNAEVKPHSQNQTKPRKAYGKSKTKFQPQHFEALKVEEITGFSNTITGRLIWEMGLEEDEITWYSNSF